MNWLILIGNDHSQTIENAELARKRAQVLSELHPYPYTIIQGSDLAPSSRAWTASRTRIIWLLILPGSITTMPPFLRTVLADTQTTASITFSCLLVLASANLSKDSLQSVAADRPVFIKAYAPWCGTNAVFIP